MRKKNMKKGIALLLALSLAIPVVSLTPSASVVNAADVSSVNEVGDINGNGIAASDLVAVKKNAANLQLVDLNNDGKCDAADAVLMRDYLLGKIAAFYRPDTSVANNDTYLYTATDALDRQMTTVDVANDDKKVGMRYFLHMGTGSNKLYSVSNILKANANAYLSNDAWLMAGGGAVGQEHWWGESLFGYYTSTDAWVVDKDVQMLTDAGVDFIAIDTADGTKIYEDQLSLLLSVLTKYKAQGFNVPKVTFMETGDAVNSALQSFYSNDAYADLWYVKDGATIKSVAELTVKSVPVAKSYDGTAMSESAFYGDTYNHQRTYNGATNLTGDDASLLGYNFEYEFANAMESNASTVLVESWNEWISVRETATDSSKPIVLVDNADLNNSSDIQPMKDGYGDSYYMQLVDCIKQYKGAKITNNRLNTASVTEGVAMDMAADFQQWNKVSTHYLDYTQDILDRKAGGYEGQEVQTVSSSYLEISFAQIGGSGTNFITKEAYAGGSTVTFDMFIPSGTGAEWAAVGYSTSATSLSPDIYGFYGTLGTSFADSKYEWGKWVTCTVELPADSNSYYVWIAGEPGKNFNNQLTLIDNFKVTKGGNVLINEDFEDKDYSDTFNAKSGVASIHTETSIVLPEAETNAVLSANVGATSEGSPLSVSTKNAYMGGSTISFDAKVQSGTGWWAVCWTTDLSTANIYAWTDGAAYGQSMTTVADTWSTYTCTLPDDGNEYYVYIVSEDNANWDNKPILIDNFTVSKNGLNSVKETFDDGLDSSIFNVTSNRATTESAETNASDTAENKAAAIDINQITESGTMSFVTNYAYPANSTITLRAFVPEEAGSWWAIGASTSTTGSIYTWVDGTFSTEGKKGTWGTYTVTIPDGEGPYYLSIVGSKGEWNGSKLIIDDFKVVTADGAWAEDDFQNGLTNGMFSVNTDTAISWVTAKEEKIVYTDESGQNDIDKMKMTTDGTNLYAFVETVDAIKGFGNANCMSLFISTGNSGGCWNQYEFVVNRDSSKATAEGLTIEQYVSGAWKVVGYADYQLVGNRLQLAVPLELLQVNSAFSLEFKWADNYDENDIYSFYTKGDAAPYGRANYVYEVTGKVAAIDVDFLTMEGAMDFVTKEKYPSGTQISVKAYVPENAGSWWSMGKTADKSNGSIYTFLLYNDTTGKKGTWDTYEATLQEDAYIFIAGSKGEWSHSQLLIESVTITTPNGTAVKDNFTGGFTNGLFDVNTTDESGNVIAHLQTVEEDRSDKVAEIDMNNINSNGTSFITKDAYPGGSTATFRAKVMSSAWWGFAYTTKQDGHDVYKAAEQDKNLMSVTTVGEWKEYTIQVPAGDTPYYIYIGCGMEDADWKDKPVLLDDFKIYNAAGEMIAKDNFNLASEQRLFDTDVHVEYVEVEEDTVGGNQAASIKSGASASAFISRNAYPAGSTITLDAKVASTGNWTLNWTTNADGSGTAAASNKISYVHGAWADNYTYTAPTSGGPYYIYISGSDSASTALLVDNVKVKNASGTSMVKDNFNHPFSESMFGVDTSYVSLVKVEADVVEDGIDFNAYGAPTVGGTVSEATAAQLDEAYADMAAAGFTKAIAMHEGWSDATGNTLLETAAARTASADAAAALAIQAAEANDILYYVKDTSFYNLGKDSSDSSVIDSDMISKESDFKSVIENIFGSTTGSKSYLTSSAYAGHFAADEPTYKGKDLTAVKYQTNYYNAQMNTLGVEGEMLVNLFGAFYAKTNGFLGIGNYDYTDYIESYLENGGKTLGYFSWDNYPFVDSAKETESGSAANHLSTYLYNYEYLAGVAKTNNMELRNMVQAMGDGTGVRELTGADDLRFQIYSGLAFGVKEFTYYQYSNSSTRNDKTTGFLYEYSTQETTETYDWAKEVNNEVHAIEGALDEYQWSKSYVIDNGATNEMISGMTSAVKTNSTKIAMSTGGDILASEFTAKQSDNINTNAYMFVNVEYDNASGSEKIVDGSVKKDVAVTFPSGTTALSIYQGGKQKIVPISDASYTFSIGGGEGVFVIPLS